MIDKLFKKYQLHNILILILLVLIIILSFVPILPIWSYYGRDETYRVIRILKYHSYYEGFKIYSKPKVFLDYLYIVSYYGTYLFTFLPIVFTVLYKKIVVNILLFIDTSLFIIVSFSNSNIVAFSAIASIIGIYLLVMSIILDIQEHKDGLDNYKEKDESQLIFAKLIKDKRKEKHLTQQDLASKTNISRSLIAKFETGASLPNPRQKRTLIDALEIDEEKDYEKDHQ